MARHITTSNGDILRTDVAGLQSALLSCLGEAERGITRGATKPLEYLDALKRIVELARTGLRGAAEWRADNPVRVIADAASDKVSESLKSGL